MSVVEEKARLRLRVITPVHVWSGEDLSLNLDYCYANGKVYLIDFFKLDEKTRNNIVLRRMPVPCPPRSGVVEVLDANTDISRFKSIKKHLRLGGVRLIPGSTIKGVLRTAFLYHIFKNDKRLYNSVVNEIRDKLITIQQSPTRTARRTAKEVAVPIEAHLKQPVNSFAIDAFSRVVVSDPLSHSISSAVYLAEVYELSGNTIRFKVASPLEVLLPGSTIEYTIGIMKRKEFNAHGRITSILPRIEEKYSMVSLEVLRKSLREFSIDTIDYELKRVNSTRDLDHYAKMLKELKAKVSDNTFYVKIGYMCGHKFKTIDLALDSNTAGILKSSMSILVSRSTHGRINIWDDLTVKLTRVENRLVGIGWVELALS